MTANLGQDFYVDDLFKSQQLEFQVNQRLEELYEGIVLPLVKAWEDYDFYFEDELHKALSEEGVEDIEYVGDIFKSWLVEDSEELCKHLDVEDLIGAIDEDLAKAYKPEGSSFGSNPSKTAKKGKFGIDINELHSGPRIPYKDSKVGLKPKHEPNRNLTVWADSNSMNSPSSAANEKHFSIEPQKVTPKKVLAGRSTDSRYGGINTSAPNKSLSPDRLAGRKAVKQLYSNKARGVNLHEEATRVKKS